MANIIEENERQVLLQFRQRVADLMPKLNDYKRHDIWLLKWLRARGLNVAKAEEMLRNYMKWREDEKMDEILNWTPPEFMLKEFPFQIPGFDNDGCLVATVHVGKWNIKRALAKGEKKDFIRYGLLLSEMAMNYMEHISTEDRLVYQGVGVADLEGFSITSVLSKDIIQMAIEMIGIFESYFPEVLKCAWIVNAPRLIDVAYNILKPFVSERTLSKVRIHGCNTIEWRSALLKTIPDDQLPSRFGGSKTSCRDYNFCTGYEIFPWYDTLTESEMKTILIGGGKKHVVEYHLQAGHSISWNFRSADYCIGYAIQFRSKEEATHETLFECQYVDSHLYLQRGALVASRSGMYGLVLDNSLSKFRAKNVHYGVRLQLTAPPCYFCLTDNYRHLCL